MREIDRRSYLRHTDQATAAHLLVNQTHMKTSTAEQLFGVETTYGLRRQLYQLELDAKEIQREVAQDDHRLGNFLHNLNRRIDLLTTFICESSDEAQQNVIDISPAGLSYLSNDLIPKDSLLAIHLVITTVNLGVAGFARVRYCNFSDNDQYCIGAQFMSLNSESEALIERHIVSLQSAARRERLTRSGLA